MAHIKKPISRCNLLGCLAVLTFLAGCTIANGLPISSASTPDYTPIIVIPEGTKLPSKAKLVSIQDLIANPEQYADQFVVVHGFNEGNFAIPACSPYYGPIDNWGLQAGPYIHYPGGAAGYEPPLIEVSNIFLGVTNDWAEVHNIREKKAAVWGWWRLYGGPIGCGQVDPQGNPIPPTLEPGEQHWYLDAVKLQWLESIEVSTPEK